MKKNVITFGLIAGAIVSALMGVTVAMCYADGKTHGNMYLGYATMLIAFSMIFVAVKNYRDKYNGGEITFGKGFMIGLYISLIASTLYVVTWLIIYYKFMPDFMEKYATHTLTEAKASGASAKELSEQAAKMNTYKQMYKNPVFVVLFTYVEILPVGLIIALITALVLKKRPTDNILATN
ncbi:DUF4199 domain-containing protein [Mucilaginibacter ginsenosidivorax]|uniref:DUF4199 domain-containing protein n=1 Tax=Mucilaginibacter ginsenosidivorax TaxID=862126 RepID=A0A5B8VT95_9SPHI|nr:DUF4199 domain-containing protein [Mucilaginibacter ginsenosidivorax]QEC74503.1 DUF4199 domain-containing protein [Mucilaginibacter ginsenosidivorax]